MATRKTKKIDAQPELPTINDAPVVVDPEAEVEAEEIVPEGTLICALTGERRTDNEQEQTIQSFIEQLHREYGVALEDMARDVSVAAVTYDNAGNAKKKSRSVQLVVYEHGRPHSIDNIIRVALIAKPGTKPDAKATALLEEVLGGLSEERPEVFGLWTNGVDLMFRMRRFQEVTGLPAFIELTDFPAPDETLADLESADRSPLRVASGDSLVRTFKRCHDYLYGNQNMRGDRAFWQLLYLIFAKILDERGSKREFFVGATERNEKDGPERIAARIKKLFERVRKEYADVFDGSERMELNDRALAYIAAELSRYSLLSTDTDAKGTAYEAITSTTLKRERGQFFTPRNVIRMMVDMLDPQPGKRVLDPACGSGGFLVVAMAHIRKLFLAQTGCPYPEQPLPSELKKVDPLIRNYAGQCLFGIDVDPELRKAARMNMVMNNDGHGNIFNFSSLEFVAAYHENSTEGARKLRTPEMDRMLQTSGLGTFDYVFTNPPFGAKIPVDNEDVLLSFDLGHTWKRSGAGWVKGAVQKKVAPEILFIEACYRFLKPDGVMALVLPNGILGNPGEQMEFVRWWMLRHMELLASVDLPAEAFLPQVSVQASCVFLRRRHESEMQMTGGKAPKQRPVFMAIAEACGHGRRGETTWVRNPDGSEKIEERPVVERREKNGNPLPPETRKRLMKELADDLPWVADQFRKSQEEARGNK